MKNWIAIALLAGLVGCSSSTTTDKTAPTETPPPAAQPTPEPAPVPEPPTPPATEAPKETPKATAKEAPKAASNADKSAPKADTKPANKPDTGAKLKPGLYAHFDTSMGKFTAELNEKEAPITVANFAGLASGEKEWTDPKTGQKQKKPYYDGLTFHRIIDGFMIQGGDPLGNGTGGPGFTIKDEYNKLNHNQVGTLAMARTGAPDSAGSQFYITVAATPFLDGQRPPYVVFGQVIDGTDTVLNIGKTPTAPGDRPITPVIIKSVKIERVK